MRKFTIALCLLLWLVVPRVSSPAAGPLDGEFEVRSAFVVIDHGVLQLNVHVQYPVNDRIRSALQDGVTLAFDLGLNITPAPPALVECRRCSRRHCVASSPITP